MKKTVTAPIETELSPKQFAEKRLKYLRKELRAERISYGELNELQALAPFIDPGDVELLEAAGVPETKIAEHFPHDVCPECGSSSVPVEGVPDQTLRGCPKCHHTWTESLSRPATKAKHTPGPWKVKGGFIIREELEVVTTHGTAITCICQMHGQLMRQSKPNARLIAAAPELLAALGTARKSIAFARNSVPSSMAAYAQLTVDLGMVDAAIQKATP